MLVDPRSRFGILSAEIIPANEFLPFIDGMTPEVAQSRHLRTSSVFRAARRLQRRVRQCLGHASRHW